MYIKTLLLTLLITLPFSLLAQGVGIPLNTDTYHIIDRLEIKTGLPNPSHSAIKFFQRGDVANFAIQIDTSLLRLTIKDRRDLYYLFKDNNDW